MDIGTATGPCGISTIEMYGTGFGNAMMIWGIQSSTGWVISYSVSITYEGTAAAGVVPFSGIPLDINTGDYTNQYTGYGDASAFLSGTVQTLFADCDILNPSVRVRI